MMNKNGLLWLTITLIFSLSAFAGEKKKVGVCANVDYAEDNPRVCELAQQIENEEWAKKEATPAERKAMAKVKKENNPKPARRIVFVPPPLIIDGNQGGGGNVFYPNVFYPNAQSGPPKK